MAACLTIYATPRTFRYRQSFSKITPDKEFGMDISPSTILPDLATRQQVADYTQTSIPTLARWAAEGKGPRFVKLGARVRYRKADVLAWLDSLEPA
jgi:excisionase family DNA binding protein